MKVKVLAIGTRMPKWVSDGYQEYARRMPSRLTLELQELALARRGKGEPTARAIESEGKAAIESLKSGDYLVVLDVKGKPISTEQLAQSLSKWEMEGLSRVVLLIGGPDGVSNECLDRADKVWSLSALTMPHPLVRVLLVEQLYRACMINAGHPYHRD